MLPVSHIRSLMVVCLTVPVRLTVGYNVTKDATGHSDYHFDLHDLATHGPSSKRRQASFIVDQAFWAYDQLVTWKVSKERQSAMTALCSSDSEAKRGMLARDSS